MQTLLETVRDLTVALTQEQDLPALLQRILDHTQHLLEAQGGIMYLWEEADQVLVPQVWSGEALWGQTVCLHSGEGLAGMVLQRHRDFAPETASERAATRALAEPLCYRASVVGVIVLYRQGPQQPFLPTDGTILALFASQAALAVGHARLQQESQSQMAMLRQSNTTLHSEIRKRQQVGSTLETHARQQAVVATLGQHALRATNLEALMDEVVHRVADTLQVTYCTVLELLPEENSLRIHASAGLPETLIAQARLSTSPDTYTGYTLCANEPVVVLNLRTETRFQPHIMHHDGVVSCMGVLIHGLGQPFGLLGAFATTARTFSNDDVHFLEAVAHVLASSIVRQRLDVQMQHGQKMQAIGTLAGGIAHDFNNMLAAILGYTELVTDDVPRDSLMWRNLQHVLTAAMRARDLVQQILAFSRQNTPQRQEVHLHLLVREALALIRASLPSTIAIHQHIEPDTGTVYAAPTHIHQLLLHLCTNAEHAMRVTGGVLEVRLEACAVDAALATTHPALTSGHYVQLTVRDTGHGMAPEVLERICEPFFTTKDVGEGTGMGLAVVHGIVASHDGVMTVSSTPGQGTTCVIYLPRSDRANVGFLPTSPTTLYGHKHILFVDDEEVLVELGRETLTRLGYRVTAYTSSTEALDAFQATPDLFDLVITDQTMPLLTGEGLAKALRTIRPALPIILCTGFSHAMTEEKARTLGLDAFLMKPMVGRDLDVTIRRVLAQRQAASSPEQPKTG